MKYYFRRLFHYCQTIFERIYGLDFTKREDCSKENHVSYAASTPFIRKILKKYFEETHIDGEDSIIDIGCGKGKMIAEFSKYPFGRIGGLEYEKELLDICKRNLAIMHVYRVDLYLGDAQNFDFYDKYNYFYLFNPFHGYIMDGFIDKLIESIDNKPRTIRVIYFNPVDKELFFAKGFIIEKMLKHGILVLKKGGK